MERRADYAVIQGLSDRLNDFLTATTEYRRMEAEWRNRIETKMDNVATQEDYEKLWEAMEAKETRLKRIETFITWGSGVAAAIVALFSDLGKKLAGMLL